MSDGGAVSGAPQPSRLAAPHRRSARRCEPIVLLDHLDAKGLPVPPAIKDRDGREIQELEGRPACLIKFLPGVSLSHPTPAQARAAGEALGAMHQAVADFAETRANSMGLGSWRVLLERCGRDVDTIAPGLFDRIAKALAAVERVWPTHLATSAIHARRRIGSRLRAQ